MCRGGGGKRSLRRSTPTPKRGVRGPGRDPQTGCGGPEPQTKRLKGAEGQARWARKNLSFSQTTTRRGGGRLLGTTLTLKGLLRSGSANGLLSKSDISLALGVTHRTQAQRERDEARPPPPCALTSPPPPPPPPSRSGCSSRGHPAGRATEHARCHGLPAGGAAPVRRPVLAGRDPAFRALATTE